MKNILAKILVVVALSTVVVGNATAQAFQSKLNVKALETAKQSVSLNASTADSQLDVAQIPDPEIREFATKLVHDFCTVDYREASKLMRNIKPYAHPDQSWNLRALLTARIESIEKNKFRIEVTELDASKLTITEETNVKGIVATHVTVPIAVKVTSDLDASVVEQNFIFGIYLVKMPRVPSNPDGLAIWSIGREKDGIIKK